MKSFSWIYHTLLYFRFTKTNCYMYVESQYHLLLLIQASKIHWVFDRTYLQLNEYETSPYLFQFFQSNTTVCLTIYEFYKIFERKFEPEIVLFWILQKKTISLSHSVNFVTFLKLWKFQKLILFRDVSTENFLVRHWRWWVESAPAG